MKKLKDLLADRTIKLAEIRALASKESAGETLGDTERARFDALETEIRSLDDKVRRAETLAEFERRAAADPIGDSGATPDLSRYSVARAVQGAMAHKLDGLEGECHAELSRGRETRGVLIPTEILLGERRAQIVGDATKGGTLVSTQLAPLADRFRPALLTESMGATVLRNLTGFLDLPNMATSGTHYWIGEGQASTRSETTFSSKSMAPKTISGEYEMSRRMMIQSSTSIEDLLRRDLGFILAQGLDAAAIKNRSASPLEPMGILDETGLEKVTTETLLADTNANLIAALELDNVTGTRAFLTNPKVMKDVRKIKDTTNRIIPISEIFHGERIETTNQVPDNIGAGSNKSALICGLWSELIVAYWSAVDILANPYHSDVASKGGALLHAFLDADVAVRHVEAFAYAEI